MNVDKTSLSKLWIAWQLLIVSAIIFTAIEIPFSFVLNLPIAKWELWVDFIVTIVFIVDIGYNCLSRIKGHKFTINNFFSNLSLFLTLDLIASIPYCLLSYQFGLSRGFAILRILRLFRLIKIINESTAIGNLNVIPFIIKIPIVLISSVIAVVWISSGWMLIYPPTSDADIVTYINKAIYWAITTLTTVGYGDITPSTNIGRVYTSFIMVLGVGVYGLVIGSVSRMIAIADRYKEQSREKIRDLNVFLSYYNVPQNLRNAAFGYYNHILAKRLSDNDTQIISDLPNAIQNELKVYVNLKLITNLAAFDLCSDTCLREISSKLKQVSFSPSEQIIKKGDVGNEMFIVGLGSAEVKTDDGKIMATIKEGKFFGEIALLEETVRTANVFAKEYCDLYILSKDNFLNIIKKYPELLKSMNRFMANIPEKK